MRRTTDRRPVHVDELEPLVADVPRGVYPARAAVAPGRIDRALQRIGMRRERHQTRTLLHEAERGADIDLP